ncbi:MAG: lysophospholipase [Planctomycetia bacterium]|nr:lysophospholipase [Planctomycetia bacterium]
MSLIALHFASGAAFFTGTACLLVGVLVVTRRRGRFASAVGRLLILLGVFAVVISASPLPVWAYGIWLASLVAWGTTSARTKPPKRLWRTMGLVSCVGWSLMAVSWELSYQLPPRPPPGQWQRLVVVGDSLSAEDFTEGGDPWPKRLARDHRIRVDNLAFSGAQSASAAKRIADDDLSGALVILEIGGNDLLGAIAADDFERGLDRLLSLVCRDDNAVVMLELPLPPLYNRYGEVQRRLAGQYRVSLIPKRYFAGVFAGSTATIDSLHLSAVGHRKMADMIWTFVAPAISDSAHPTPHPAFPP